MDKFVVQQLGLTAFLVGGRVDFVLDGPAMEKPARVSAFANAPKAKITLDGKQIKVTGSECDESGEPVKLLVKFGRSELKLGRRKNASGPVSFYRSLEPSNTVGAPKTAEQVLELLAAFS